MDKKNVTQVKGGLHKDNSRIDTPPGTYQYALNAVNETEVGDLFFLSNEESNEPCGVLPDGYRPVGKVYIGGNKTMIFSVSADNLTSEIGVTDTNCGYVTHVNGDLGFKITHQIDATYRLRRGCETTVYWVDGKNNKPMYYVTEKPEQFQDGLGNWVKNKFELQRSYNNVPVFQEVELLNSGGQLSPGSLNVAIQYLDENLNPTEWIITTEVVKVYNDDTTESYLDINGSINIETGAEFEDYRNFADTDKSLRIVLDNLDETFLYYRLAFIEATAGTGLINAVNYTENLPIQNKIFIYTGVNFAATGTELEIQAFNSIVESAGSIEQADNMLLLGDTQGKQIDFCKLQKYASGIKADMTTRKVLLNQMIDKANPKSPTASFEGIGYMPGEIYSFGIVYVFRDGTQSPVYHIPGKSNNIIDTDLNNVSEDFIFQPGEGGQKVYPMAIDNESLNSVYNDNSSCSSSDYWGTDSMGNALKFARVRHHRFPLRSKLDLDLVTLDNTIGGTDEYFQVQLRITGDLITHTICDQTAIDAGECSVIGEEVPLPPFQARITYTVEGVQDTLIVNILPSDFIGNDLTTAIDLYELSNFNTTDAIVIISIEESLADGTSANIGVESGTGDAEHGSLSYVASVVPATFTAETRIYSSEILGIQFSGVVLPPISATNGEEIIGYYIVRNERTETEKTVLDSAVLVPSVTNDKYISHGLLFPEFEVGDRKISDKVYGLISPEHKFKDKKYPEFTTMQQEGQFGLVARNKSKSRYLDITDGTSYDPSVHKSGGGRDGDGWSLKAITRDNITEFEKAYEGFNFVQDEVENFFYLNALQSKEIEVEDDSLSVYNISGDNKVGIMQLKEDNPSRIDNKLPYVYLRRPIADSYSTFRTLPYYKTSINMHEFFLDNGDSDPLSATAVEFNGDTYVTPMRYVNTMWWDNRVAKRAGRTSVWDYVIGALLIGIGAILSLWGVGIAVIAAGIAVIGAGALFISSGIERDALVRAYYSEYDKGLRETLLDDWVNHEYVELPCNRDGGGGPFGPNTCDTPQDDEIQWAADCVTDLWFESQVNMSLRYGMTSRDSTFLGAPGKVETGNEILEQSYEHFDIWKVRDTSLYPFTKLDNYVMDKLLVFNPEREDSRTYIGHPLGEWYEINPDYDRTNKQKVFFHLPTEYDCCSDCQEDFPHRVHYSEQSFQEELTDNFRVFLPNNYRDMEGETGRITDLFRIKNNIYIHTEEGLWHQPQNYQERVTGDIVSFLGTGGYFNVPARRILDDNKSSGGTRHKEATMKTKHGVFFVSENENKIYQFDGNKLEAISDLGMSNWFKENLKIQLLEEYFASDGKKFPYDGNPSNPFGVGFVSAYDTKKERIIFTKKDKILSDDLATGDDFEVCTPDDGNMVIFNDFQQTIDDRLADGWTYAGIVDCRMKFEKITFTTEIQTGQTVITTVIPPDTIVIPFFDTTSMTGATITNISVTLDTWFPGFKASVNGGDNNVTFLNPGTWNNWGTENWVKDVPQLVLDNVGGGLNVLILAFVDEVNPNFHGNTISNPMSAPTSGTASKYIESAVHFTNVLHSQFNTFIGINYPIMRDNNTDKEYLQHTIAAIEGRSMTQVEVNALDQNPLFSNGDWEILKDNLMSNPYVGQPILRDYGWLYKENRVDGVNNNGSAECPIDGFSVIPPCQFTNDVNDVLTTSTTTEIVDVDIEIQVPQLNTEYVDGVPVDLEKANNSWTMSFSLKAKSWTSWHSYLPDFYYYISEKFYSWKNGKTASKLVEEVPVPTNAIWKHNKKGEYQNFYGERMPFSIEYTAMSGPLKTKIWDDITLHTEAKRYNETMKEYVDVDGVTFNKAIFYNTRQCTGELALQVKGTGVADEDFMSQQIVDVDPGTIIIDKNEKDWSLNDIRDIRIDYEQPIFNSDILVRQDDYYTDKILNSSALDENKDWDQLESLRDKYLVIRLIFDTFDDVKLIMNYSVENETDSLT
jgi:hypothetical protein